MTDNVKHSTSYFHEVVAKAFEMFKNGYEPVMETPFQPRRQGSAFVVEYKLVREPLDEVVNFDIDKMDEALKSDRIEVPEDLSMEDFDQFMKERQLTIHEKWEIDDQTNFEVDEEKKLAESESCGKLFTKEQLDELYWTNLQEVGRKFGVKQRDRKKLTKMILEAQEKENALAKTDSGT